jgi:protein-tyrosine-phosphatase
VGDAYMTAHEAVALLTELKERRAADPSLRLVLQLAREVMEQRPPYEDPQTDDQRMRNATADLVQRALSALSKILKDGT